MHTGGAVVIEFPKPHDHEPLTDERLRHIARHERELERLLEDACRDLENGADYVATDLRLQRRARPALAVTYEGV
jgi:hypothetical protein